MKYKNKKKALLAILLTLLTTNSYASLDSPTSEHTSLELKYLGERKTSDFLGSKNTYDKLNCTIEVSDKILHSPKKLPLKKNLNFTSVTVSNTSLDLMQSAPIQTKGGVGETQYIMLNGYCMRSFDKKTGKPDGVLDTDICAFTGLNALGWSIVYDRFCKKWLVVFSAATQALEFADLGTTLAIAEDSIITDHTIWKFFHMNILARTVCQLSVDKHNIYFTSYSFNGILPHTTPTRAAVINKNSLYSATLPNEPVATQPTREPFLDTPRPKSMVFLALPGPGPSGTLIDTLSPANNFDDEAPFGYLVSANSTLPRSSKILLYKVVRPLNTGSILNPIAITVPPYNKPIKAPYKGNMHAQAGETPIFGGLFNESHIQNQQLYFVQTVCVDSSGRPSTASNPGSRNGIQWYQVDLTGDRHGNGCGKHHKPVLVQTGLIFDSNSNTKSPKHYYFPAIMSDKHGNVIVGGTVSGQNDFPNTFMTQRKKNDPKGFMSKPELLSNNTSHPWNHYNNQDVGLVSQFSNGQGRSCILSSGMCLDPNGKSIWFSGNFAGVENGWAVQTTKFNAPSKCK